MSIKTFRAASVQEAIARVKAELGSEAVILSTRKLARDPRNPYAGAFEVTASLEESKKTPLKKEGKALFTREVSVEKIKKNSSPQSFVENKKSLDSILDRAEDVFSSDKNSSLVWQQLQSELLNIRDILFLLNKDGKVPDFILEQEEGLSLYKRLIATGLSERRSKELMERAFKKHFEDKETLSRRVFVELMSLVESFAPFELIREGASIAAFVGPTGVGKTTTIAKLAADLSLKQKLKVGLISIDSYRIGALEQLKTYAGIMGLPCLPAFTREDLQTALRQMQGRDVILIDTAGLSHLDYQRMEELASLIGGRQAISTHLVLSAATGRDNMKEAAANFSRLAPRSYVFTKLDETRKRGALLDQLWDYPLPVSYISDGQRVPEDIYPVLRKDFLQRIFKDI